MKDLGSFFLTCILCLGCSGNAPDSRIDDKKTYLKLSSKEPIARMLAPVFASDTKEIVHSFIINNDTKEAVKFVRVVQSCTCTQADLSQKELQPGESATFVMKVNIQTRVGPQIINARLISEGGDAWVCELRTVIHRAVHFVPDNLNVGLVNRNEKKEIVLTLEATGSTIVDIPSIEKVSAEGCEVTVLPPGPIEELQLEAFKRNYPIRLTVLPSAQVGEHRCELTAKVKRNNKIESYPLHVQWLVRSNYKLTPSRAFFGKVSDGKKTETVNLKRLDGEEVRIKAVRSNHPAILCELVHDDGKTSRKLNIQLQADKLDGSLWGEITVELDDPVEPNIKVPFAAVK
jgi:hypothetical protein